MRLDGVRLNQLSLARQLSGSLALSGQRLQLHAKGLRPDELLDLDMALALGGPGQQQDGGQRGGGQGLGLATGEEGPDELLALEASRRRLVAGGGDASYPLLPYTLPAARNSQFQLRRGPLLIASDVGGRAQG